MGLGALSRIPARYSDLMPATVPEAGHHSEVMPATPAKAVQKV
jgi:hypothetical protein